MVKQLLLEAGNHSSISFHQIRCSFCSFAVDIEIRLWCLKLVEGIQDPGPVASNNLGSQKNVLFFGHTLYQITIQFRFLWQGTVISLIVWEECFCLWPLSQMLFITNWLWVSLFLLKSFKDIVQCTYLIFSLITTEEFGTKDESIG